jgi:hypothetical protein
MRGCSGVGVTVGVAVAVAVAVAVGVAVAVAVAVAGGVDVAVAGGRVAVAGAATMAGPVGEEQPAARRSRRVRSRVRGRVIVRVSFHSGQQIEILRFGHDLVAEVRAKETRGVEIDSAAE